MLCSQGDQIGIAPRMFKALVGRGHPEFSTNRQQDAQEFLLHFINMVEVKSHSHSASLFGSPAFLLHYYFFPPTEELPLWVQPIRSLQVPGGGEDCVSAVTESQVHTAGGLHRPAACADGPGYQHRWRADVQLNLQFYTWSACMSCAHRGVQRP